VTCSVVVTTVALVVLVAATTGMVTVSCAPSFGSAKVLATRPLRSTGTCSRCQACADSARRSEADHVLLEVSPLLTVAAARDLLVFTTVGRTDVMLCSWLVPTRVPSIVTVKFSRSIALIA
jgi:hypothetical protein